eukprot:CAMPEP_0114620012 /NCGR_PEP_ID=MMETSP0168-20121206/8501_1 /TAXON_ID=95228 ORGANISM="Vannella sp., Strain DIVA3 517/6/12" /NCGR_SAMPLE_ID=MMETSP0168 /ASSEMBLY_ACC=CAM_ASM_000044 /LENGTH=601 /DNA_ID=CAMNT_0001831181 /DNA_START=190 /DNA_END=1993 /DNA_ORIENTATION=+
MARASLLYLRGLEYAGVRGRVRAADAWRVSQFGELRSREALKSRITSNSTFVRRQCVSRILEGAQGCVNTCNWNESGDLLVGSGDDTFLQVWHGPMFKETARVATGHTRNVFCAQFVPEAEGVSVVTAAMDGAVHLVNVDQEDVTVLYEGEGDFAMKLAFVPHCPGVVLSTHGNGLVHMIDIRSSSEPNPVLSLQKQALGVSFDPLNPTQFAVGAEDHLVRVFDIRALAEEDSDPKPVRVYSTPELLNRYGSYPGETSRVRRRVTASDVSFSGHGELLVNYSNSALTLFDCTSPTSGDTEERYGDIVYSNVIMTYGHRENSQTFLKEANFFLDEQYVVTGGDSGCVYGWHKTSGQLLLMAQADNTILNGVSPHPVLPLLATCGIDSNVKIFEALLEAGEVDDTDEVGERPRPDKFYAEPNPFAGNRFLAMMLGRMYDDSDVPGILVHDECVRLVQGMQDKKAEGNALFAQHDYRGALANYKFVLENMRTHATSKRLHETMMQLYCACLLNAAACHAKLGEWEDVTKLCTRVLNGDSTNVKALYRMSEAFLRRGLVREARECLRHLVAKAPSDPNIQRLSAEIACAPEQDPPASPPSSSPAS